jgi:hypothetical protein
MQCDDPQGAQVDSHLHGIDIRAAARIPSLKYRNDCLQRSASSLSKIKSETAHDYYCQKIALHEFKISTAILWPCNFRAMKIADLLMPGYSVGNYHFQKEGTGICWLIAINRTYWRRHH